MLWQSGRRSANIEDRRGVPGGRIVGGGGALIAIGIVVALLGGDPTMLLNEGFSRISMQTQNSSLPKEEQDKMADFVSTVLASTEDYWHKEFSGYPEPRLVLFSGAVSSACGQASAAVGPFYCSRDETIYLDLEFFHDLETKFGAAGDFAQAYVIAHEVGHHVQNITGFFKQADDYRLASQDIKNIRNVVSVQTELMADCLAGMWAKGAEKQSILEMGDMQEALNAASKIGDDVLQQKTQGVVVPDSFTHGTGGERHAAFEMGLENTMGVNGCNPYFTYSASPNG